jgi:hypothetical protein
MEIWFQDEARVGQKNGLVYQWAKKGSRPRQPYLSDQVFEDYDKIVDACCRAWNSLVKETGRITSIASRKWTENGQ